MRFIAHTLKTEVNTIVRDLETLKKNVQTEILIAVKKQTSHLKVPQQDDSLLKTSIEGLLLNAHIEN